MRHSDVLGKVGGGKSVMVASQLQDSRSDRNVPLPCGGEAADLPSGALENLRGEDAVDE